MSCFYANDPANTLENNKLLLPHVMMAGATPANAFLDSRSRLLVAGALARAIAKMYCTDSTYGTPASPEAIHVVRNKHMLWYWHTVQASSCYGIKALVETWRLGEAQRTMLDTSAFVLAQSLATLGAQSLISMIKSLSSARTMMRTCKGRNSEGISNPAGIGQEL